MTTQQEAYEAAEKTWQFERKVSLPIMATILVMILSGAAAFYKVEAQTSKNADAIERLEPVPEDIARIQVQLDQLRSQQAELRSAVSASSAESRSADSMQLQALQEVLLAIARLEERLESR